MTFSRWRRGQEMANQAAASQATRGAAAAPQQPTNRPTNQSGGSPDWFIR